MTNAEPSPSARPPSSSRDVPSDPSALGDHRAVLAALTGTTTADALAGLGLLRGLRNHLDEVERSLIEAARDGGASWSAVAEALSLASRQAAEQRWLRLAGPVAGDVRRHRVNRQRQQRIDRDYGEPVVTLRVAVRAAERVLRANHEWTSCRPVGELARATLAAAGDAPPGGLYDLARSALADLAEVVNAASGFDVPAPIRVATDRLRVAIETAAPGG
ncbi:hypothetical protein [Plantactinospora sp. GCM10030261]|uniref:hypothetical protein n=1 Tax=Plantactinospora sp. GCM10030261 TaxID=3273420 RepID=UPI0036229221